MWPYSCEMPRDVADVTARAYGHMQRTSQACDGAARTRPRDSLLLLNFAGGLVVVAQRRRVRACRADGFDLVVLGRPTPEIDAQAASGAKHADAMQVIFDFVEIEYVGITF